MEILEKTILVLIPTFGIIGTLLIMNADDKKVKENPLVGIIKAASQLKPDVDVSSVHSHEKFIYPHNKKMKRRKYLGIGLLVVAFLLTIYTVFF